jgi:hypothetical protein
MSSFTVSQGIVESGTSVVANPTSVLPIVIKYVGENFNAYDNRTGVSAVDASPITLVSSVPSGKVYQLIARVNLVSISGGSSPAVLYKIIWTEVGASAASSVTLSEGTVGSSAVYSDVIQPKAGSSITVQVLSSGSPTAFSANVFCSLQ